MKKQLFIFLFSVIFLFGILLRMYNLGSLPQSLDWDEVSQAYNSYSLLLTGKDEYGISYPWTIRSFNDYKTPVYVYITILPIKLLGLNPFAERLPSALAGILTILLVFGLTYEILYKYSFKKIISLLSMFSFVISPWAIQFSRTAFDANVGVFFVVLGAWLFLYGVRKNIVSLSLSGIIFLGISIYTTHSEKIFTPLLFLCLLFFTRKYFLKKRILLFAFLFFFLFINLFWLLDTKTRARSSGVLFTSSATKLLEKSLNQKVFDQKNNDYLGTILHNRRLVYVNKYLENYLSHYDLNYLFIHGDNARHHAPEVGVLYLFSLPFLVGGLYFIISRKVYAGYLVIAWLLLAPLASGFAIDAPNYQRSLIFLPSWQILEAFGWYLIFIKMKQVRFGYSIFSLAIVLLLFNIVYCIHQYVVHTDLIYGKYWQYGYKEAIDYTKQFQNTDKKIFFENDIEQGYIFYLFYNKYDPKKYLNNGGSNRKEKQCFSIDNAYFGSCSTLFQPGDIYITTRSQEATIFQKLQTIYYKSGETAINIYQKRK